MSRTIRRKQGIGWCYGPRTISDQLEDYCYEWIVWPGDDKYLHLRRGVVYIDPKSKEGKKRIAKFHSDAGHWHSKGGPSWWICQYMQRPYRRDAKRQIQKALNDDNYEVIIQDKPKRDYWD